MEAVRGQVHIDFHTPPEVKEVGRDFDAEHFAERLSRCKVEAATIFARCHYGMCYYPTDIGIQHPGLAGRDLLGETIAALKSRDIRAHLYTTVGWDEASADAHPEWLQVRKDGTAAVQFMPDPSTGVPTPRWRFLNWLHPEYAAFLDAHVEELLERYSLDGLFFDILFLEADSCWSDVSVGLREEYGYLEDDWISHRRFELLAQRRFSSHMTGLIRKRNETCSIFYNTPFVAPAYSLHGIRTRLGDVSHWEIESLPSGDWGFDHFEPVARFFENEPMPWAALTARFLKSWGDFGGLKPEPELEFECFRAQAIGGGMIVGDQMEPAGSLDAPAWDAIRRVYEKLADADAFYSDSSFVPRVGILSADQVNIGESESRASTRGALELFAELGYDCALIDDAHPFTKFELIVAPDSVLLDRVLKFRMDEYHEAGGMLILSGRSGQNHYGEQQLMLLPGIQNGLEEVRPTYWRTRPGVDVLPDLDAVIYEAGVRMAPHDDAEVWIDRVYPADYESFFSHAQSPPSRETSGWPACIRKDNVIWFADPIFREWARHANPVVKPILAHAVETLIGPPTVTCDLGPSVRLYPRKKQDTLLLTLLHYPRRRIGEAREVIDTAGRFGGGLLTFERPVPEVRLFGESALDQKSPTEAILPDRTGRLLLEVPGFFPD